MLPSETTANGFITAITPWYALTFSARVNMARTQVSPRAASSDSVW